MTWEEKLSALQCVAETALRMRKPGDWYVSMRAGIGGGGMIRGEFGNGKTPEEAVNAHWDAYVTHLPSDRYVVTGPEDNTRVRWAGYMWRDAT